MSEQNPSTDLNVQIEREVQRRVAARMRQHGTEVEELRSIIQQCQNDLVRQHGIITRLTSEPLTFGTLLKSHVYPDPSKFKANDEVIVIDPNSPYRFKGGRIISGLNGTPVIDDEGFVFVKLIDDTEMRFSVGLEGKEPAQIRLTQKDDGTYAVVSLDGKPWEVRGVPDLDMAVGDCVKVKPDTKAIVSRSYSLTAGPICTVAAVHESSVEVMHKGDLHLVYNPRRIPLEEGDRIATDPTMFCIIEKLPQDNNQKYRLTTDLTLTWDDVGGLDSAKQELRDALELPFLHKDLYEHYKMQAIRGVLLFGPPGCGKTLLARVAARAIADIHGASALDTGYIFVKAPELLDKWVGNTEKEIRSLFERGRRHYRQHGYKAILAIDEADAILPTRNTRVSSGVFETIVPMFLSEMDGIDERKTEANPIVILMTNRSDAIDPAVTRPGRISRHIKIERPTEMSAIDILDIHTRDMPFVDEGSRMSVLALTASDLFSKSRLLYRVNNEHDFTLGDSVNGAMLENIAEIAKANALHRDLVDKTRTGVTTEDLRQAVQKTYRQQRGINHSYDLQDFAEKLGIQPHQMSVDRCFGAA